MYIYNVSIKLIPEIEQEWILWMKEEHLNEVMATGMFDRYAFYELLEPSDDDGNKTFIVQYFTDHEDRYKKYIEDFAPALREKGYQKFGDRFIGFRSFMRSC